MALRVLLADESSTIKKVIQLSLHDFGVEVKSVSNGLDVIPVLENFKPDIVFVDVLLSKKTGYEVCSEIKSHPLHQNVPIILMWSGFMSLDESKTLSARPDARLEKPFDSEQIRNMVMGLVPKANTNPIKDYLTFPKMPEFSENVEKVKTTLSENKPNLHQPIPTLSEDENLAKMDEEWAQQPLKRSDPIPKKSEYNDFGIKDLSQAKIKVTDEFEEISFDEPAPQFDNSLERQAQSFHPTEESFSSHSLNDHHVPMSAPNTTPALLTAEQMEEIVRQEVQKMAAEVCLKVCQNLLPDIAERLVQQEIQRILLENPQK